MKILLLTILACLAFAAGYAEKPVKGAHLRLENATYNFGDVPRKGGDLVREFRFVNDGTAPLVLVRVIGASIAIEAVQDLISILTYNRTVTTHFVD